MTKIIFETVMGSRLYGTFNENSDYDYKGVFIPSVSDMIKDTTPAVIDKSTNSTKEKNTKDDIDRQYYSVGKYFNMLIKGDMNSYEMLFAPYEDATPEWKLIQKYKHEFLSKDCRGFVGYVQRQASTYGERGIRLNEVVSLINELERMSNNFIHRLDDHLEYSIKFFEEFCVGKKHTMIEHIKVNEHKTIPHIVCCNRKHPFTKPIHEIISNFQGIVDEYGDRARAAATNVGIDWKAIMHAVRIGEQTIELLETGNIVFPRYNAEYLKRIRNGEIPYSEISVYLDEILAKVPTLQTNIRDKADINLMDTLREKLYIDHIKANI